MLYDLYKGESLMNPNREDINYDDHSIRFAYVYRNTPFHSIVLCNIISKVDILSLLMEKSPLTVTCLGGGPGSDLFGLCMYRQLKKLSKGFSCYLFDLSKWQNCWINMPDSLQKYDTNSNSIVTFAQFDATEYKNPARLPRATKLIIMQYFVSEMFKYRDEFGKFFEKIAAEFLDGTVILIVEMEWQQFKNWVNTLMKQCHLECIRQWASIQVDSGGFDETINKFGDHYKELFKLNPKNKPRTFSGSVSYTLWQKPMVADKK